MFKKTTAFIFSLALSTTVVSADGVKGNTTVFNYPDALADTVLGTTNDTPWSGTGAGTINAILKYAVQAPTALASSTTGGNLSYTGISSGATTTGVPIITGAHQTYAFQLGNNTTTIYYLKMYDKASAPVCGTDTPKKTLIIPGGANGGGSNFNITAGNSYTAGIGYCLTAGIALTDSTAVPSNAVVVNIDYK